MDNETGLFYGGYSKFITCLYDVAQVMDNETGLFYGGYSKLYAVKFSSINA